MNGVDPSNSGAGSALAPLHCPQEGGTPGWENHDLRGIYRQGAGSGIHVRVTTGAESNLPGTAKLPARPAPAAVLLALQRTHLLALPLVGG